MLQSRSIVLLAGVVLAGNVMMAAQASRGSAARTPAQAPRRAPVPGPVLVGSIKEIMDGIVDPAADVVFEAVSFDVTADGVKETKPQTREEWAEVRRHALQLAEAGNLLMMSGRKVVPSGPIVEVEHDDLLPEDLTPEQIQALVDDDPAKFARLAQQLTDAATIVLRAADAMDSERLFAAGEDLDRACEACHSEYWYPTDKKPALDALSRRKK